MSVGRSLLQIVGKEVGEMAFGRDSNNCAIHEETADGRSVGRCWIYLSDGKTCSRHGDVSRVQERYVSTGKLTRECDFRKGRVDVKLSTDIQNDRKSVWCLVVLMVVFILLFISWGTTRILRSVWFDIGCGGHIKRAADANTIDLAKQELKTALVYVEDHKYTDGSTHLIFPHPSCDLGFWYTNLKASLKELEDSPSDAKQLEKTNLLMKLRETLLDQGERSVYVTVPPGITVYPNQWVYLIWGYGTLIAAVCYAVVIALRLWYREFSN